MTKKISVCFLSINLFSAFAFGEESIAEIEKEIIAQVKEKGDVKIDAIFNDRSGVLHVKDFADKNMLLIKFMTEDKKGHKKAMINYGAAPCRDAKISSSDREEKKSSDSYFFSSHQSASVAKGCFDQKLEFPKMKDTFGEFGEMFDDIFASFGKITDKIANQDIEFLKFVLEELKSHE